MKVETQAIFLGLLILGLNNNFRLFTCFTLLLGVFGTAVGPTGELPSRFVSNPTTDTKIT